MELTEITLRMVMDSGLLTPGTLIYSSTDPVQTAVVNSDGTIKISGEKVFYSPSGAAKSITDSSINGWRFWKVLLDDVYVELSFFREQYRSRIAGDRT
jgi:hypothetical protein